MFSKLVPAILALVSLTSAPAVYSYNLNQRQFVSTTAACDFVFKPVDKVPANLNLTQEFNEVIVFGVGAHAGGATVHTFGPIVVTAEPNDQFNVRDSVAIDGQEAAGTAAIVEGLRGQTLAGSSTPFVLRAAKCFLTKEQQL